MAIPNTLVVECLNCKVSKYCPNNGSSPLFHGGKKILCRLIGGYGRKPVDMSILSEESKKLAINNGGCLTIAEVPISDECSGLMTYQIVKIFAPPVLHARETINPDQLRVLTLKNQCER
jgi:hypothetical protein